MALRRVALAGALVLALATQGGAFAPVARGVQRAAPLRCEGAPKDPKAEVRAKIQLTGDASGGYFRACFRNEAKFNRCGPPTPPATAAALPHSLTLPCTPAPYSQVSQGLPHGAGRGE